MKPKTMPIDRAVELIERDHGGCDQNTCNISVALRWGFHLVAIDGWIGSGAASEEFDNVTLPYSHQEWDNECREMSRTLPHVDCPHCNTVVWLPEECDFWCESCGRNIPRPEEESA